jgi:hypothetical protein
LSPFNFEEEYPPPRMPLPPLRPPSPEGERWQVLAYITVPPHYLTCKGMKIKLG